MNTKNSSWIGWSMGLGSRAPKAWCHLSLTLYTSQQGTGGCLRTATGVSLERLVVVKRLDTAWALGCIGAMDLVNGMDGMDTRDPKGEADEALCLAKGTEGHVKARWGMQGHVVRNFSLFFLTRSQGRPSVSPPLAKGTAIISAYLALSRRISECLAFSGIFFSGVLARRRNKRKLREWVVRAGGMGRNAGEKPLAA
jgi:hypothetical protein